MNDMLLEQAADDDLAIEPDIEIEVDPDPELAIEPEPTPPATTTALTEILPADFQLPALITFIPNPALRHAADQAAAEALAVRVEGAEGLARADEALTKVRSALHVVELHLEDPIALANRLHKGLTTVRGDWCEHGKAAIETVGQRIWTEQRRLDALAAAERRKAQEEADRLARETARKEAEAAAAAQAPAPIIDEMKRQAETATAPPVSQGRGVGSSGLLKGTSTVDRWKGRLIGTPGSDDPHPAMADLSVPQRRQVLELMKAVVEGKAPLVLFELAWGVIDKRAAAERSAFSIPGLESFEVGGTRAKGTRKSH